MKRITTIIKRPWLKSILLGYKRVEHRRVSPYWTKKLEGIEVPFELRLINGMTKKAPEATVLIYKVSLLGGSTYAMYIDRIISKKYCQVKGLC